MVLQILLSLKQGLIQSLSTPKKPKWYDISLSSLKKNLDKKSKLFERYPRDPHVRGALFSTLKTYRKKKKNQKSKSITEK